MSKIQRLVDEYGIEEVGQQLEDYWLGTGETQRSLRELAEWFNQRLLEEEMDEAGMTHFDGDVENTYRLLTGDDVSSGMRAQVETTLQQDGIDVESLQQSFVSHQAVYNYLTKYRGVSRSSESASDESQIRKSRDSIQRLTSRLRAVTENSLDNLRNTERIALGEFSVFVDVQVFCEDCGRQYDVSTLLEEGGCDCEDVEA